MKISISMPFVLDYDYVPRWEEGEDAPSNAEYLSDLKNSKGVKKPKKVAIFNGITIFKSQISQKVELFFTTKIVDSIETIQFGIEAIDYNFTYDTRFKVLQQDAIFKNKLNSELRGLPAYVFWTVLYKKYNKVVSTGEQSLDAKRFWESRISEALSNGLNVYAFLNSGTKIVELHSIKDVNDVAKYYTTNVKSRNLYKLLISKEAL